MSTSCPTRPSFRLVLTMALTFSLAAAALPGPQRAASPRHASGASAGISQEAPATADPETEERAQEAYGKLGVSFEENRGQADKRVRFLARRGGSTVFLTNEEAAFVLRAPALKAAGADASPDSTFDEKPAAEEMASGAPGRPGRGPAKKEKPKSHAVWMKFGSANPWAEVTGERELPGRINYLRGDDPSKWQTDVRTYGAVRYRGIYDGVDLVYYGNEQGQMEYDFEVAPGADPNQISLLIEGADALEVDASGDLVITTPVGEMRQRRPTVYQEVRGSRREVEGGYAVEAGGRVRFALGKYDAGAPLVIDPVLEYSTYLGGGLQDGARGIAVDAARNAYIAGYTRSEDFPTKNPLQAENAAPGVFTDAFVTKLNSTGSALVYSTYLGGGDNDEARNIAVDASGNAYVAGSTYSTNFPTANAIQATMAGTFDAFVTKLNAAGSALVFSTYLGGGGGDQAWDIAVDSQGNALVTGGTGSTDYPTVNPVQATYAGTVDAFVTKFNPAGSALIYSTYLGGSIFDFGYSIATDSAGNAYVTGYAESTNFPTANAIQNAPAGGGVDAFVTKLNPAGSAFVYSTYLGGSSIDRGFGIAADSAGNAYVTGATGSSNFPAANAKQPALASASGDAFVIKFNAEGSALVYSTYLGGNNSDVGMGITVDSSGNAYVVGLTYSTNFPVAFPVKGTNSGDGDVFVTKYNAAGAAFLFSTYLGGSDTDYGNDIAADAQGSAYVTGETESTNYPVAEAIQGTSVLGHDPFVTKISVLPSIRGRVLNGSGAGVAGVTVKLTGSLVKTDVTDAAGNYSFYGLTPGGDFTVTPVKTNASFVPASRTFTNLNSNLININFAAPTLSVNNAAVTEGNAGTVSATFTVTLKPAAAQTVTVKYQTANGTTNPATSVSDYTPPPLTTLTFSPGQTSKTVTVQVKGDTLDELNETFKLLLSAPTNALITDGEGLGTITDDDAPPTVSVNNVAVNEGNAAVTTNFTISLSKPSGLTVKVKYATANGTATAPADYTAKALTTLTFAPGETTKTVPVTIAGDTRDEPAETFKLNLSAPASATIATATGTCTINDNDPPPSIAIGNKTVTEPDAGTVNAVFTVTLSAASNQTVTVKYATANGTATAPGDYTALALTTLTFTPGQTSKSVTVQVRGDVIKEANETFFVNLSAATNATISDAQGLGTITNDD
ncbi:MAG TPA: SBBP repeat-containing protein [Pyrinomonadaceae bacterium]|nr:SBBP repeat-containing protein [Pyrinomonadaceae bacterium]